MQFATPNKGPLDNFNEIINKGLQMPLDQIQLESLEDN
jgi:hypothetical protein